MKTIKASIIFFLIGIGYITAQTKGTSQISVGYGIGSFDAIIQDFDFDTNDDEGSNNGGAINIGYKYAVSDRWMLGGIFVYEKIKDDDEVSGSMVEGSATVTTIAAELDYRYISKQYFQMYSGLGLGYTFGKEEPGEPGDDDINHFNCQFTGLGIRVGDSFAGFAEIGFGYKGVINVGVSLQF